MNILKKSRKNHKKTKTNKNRKHKKKYNTRKVGGILEICKTNDKDSCKTGIIDFLAEMFRTAKNSLSQEYNINQEFTEIIKSLPGDKLNIVFEILKEEPFQTYMKSIIDVAVEKKIPITNEKFNIAKTQLLNIFEKDPEIIKELQKVNILQIQNYINTNYPLNRNNTNSSKQINKPWKGGDFGLVSIPLIIIFCIFAGTAVYQGVKYYNDKPKKNNTTVDNILEEEKEEV